MSYELPKITYCIRYELHFDLKIEIQHNYFIEDFTRNTYFDWMEDITGII